MPSLAYQDLVLRLFPRLTGGIRWGLERTEHLLDRAGNPHHRFAAIHIAGTNGKGSVAAALASVLRQSGLRTGLYTSPHLTSFRERIRVDGVPIGEAELVACAAELWPALEESGASFFEAATVLGFHALARAGVEIAVVEVGLGGRLDSTNVVSPILTVITNIDLDHAEYLGSTHAAIATEKAGIVKAGVPLITGEARPDVRQVFEQRCRELRAPIHVVEPDADASVTLAGVHFEAHTRAWGAVRLGMPLVGAHQARNGAVAVAALDHLAEDRLISRSSLVDGLARVRWPGRFQIQHADRTWIFDVAHNEAGVHALVDTFRRFEFPRPLALLVGILGDKDWARMLPPLFRLADHVVLTVPPTAPHNRAWHPDQVRRAVGGEGMEVEHHFERALTRVRSCSAPAGTVLVTGSFHTVGDAQALLGWAEVEPDFPLPHNVFCG